VTSTVWSEVSRIGDLAHPLREGMAVHSDAQVRDRIADRNREHSVASDPHAEPSIRYGAGCAAVSIGPAGAPTETDSGVRVL
jgi:hypothetical protein